VPSPSPTLPPYRSPSDADRASTPRGR
jgi:hypothetical protein